MYQNRIYYNKSLIYLLYENIFDDLKKNNLKQFIQVSHIWMAHCTKHHSTLSPSRYALDITGRAKIQRELQ